MMLGQNGPAVIRSRIRLPSLTSGGRSPRAVFGMNPARGGLVRDRPYGNRCRTLTTGTGGRGLLVQADGAERPEPWLDSAAMYPWPRSAHRRPGPGTSVSAAGRRAGPRPGRCRSGTGPASRRHWPCPRRPGRAGRGPRRPCRPRSRAAPPPPSGSSRHRPDRGSSPRQSRRSCHLSHTVTSSPSRAGAWFPVARSARGQRHCRLIMCLVCFSSRRHRSASPVTSLAPEPASWSAFWPLSEVRRILGNMRKRPRITRFDGAVLADALFLIG
jgi:hypothetical protein